MYYYIQVLMHTLKTNMILVNLHSTLNLCCWWAGEALLQFSRISSAFSSPAVFILLLNSLFTCCALEFFSSVSPGHIPHGGLAVWVWSLWLCLYTPRQTASVHAHQQYVVAVSSLFMYARAHVWWVQWRVHVSVRAHVWADCGGQRSMSGLFLSLSTLFLESESLTQDGAQLG